MKNLLIELKVIIYWKLYQLGEATYIYKNKIIDDYNEYGSRGMQGQTYSRKGFKAYKMNSWRGYKKEDES